MQTEINYTEIESLEERVSRILSKAFSLCYEDNPSRTEWPAHPINCDFAIANPDDLRPQSYYMAEIYLPEDLFDKLVYLTEGLPCWIDTYRSGRCSINDLLNRYTPEALEDRLADAERTITEVENHRNLFIARQGAVGGLRLESLPSMAA